MVSRRRFLKTSATFGAGFTLSMTLPAAASKLASGAAEAKTVANAFVRISSDNLVSIMIKHIEFGHHI